MPIDPQHLPDDATILRRMVLDLIAQLDTEKARRIKTENLLRQLLAAKSGRRSEQITDEQLALFEAELKAQGVNVEDLAKGDAGNGPDDQNPPVASDSTGAKPRGRRPLPGHLKRERTVHDLDEAEKHCSSCNQDLRHLHDYLCLTFCGAEQTESRLGGIFGISGDANGVSDRGCEDG